MGRDSSLPPGTSPACTPQRSDLHSDAVGMAAPYHPAERRVQQRQVDRALAEFSRQLATIREGEERDVSLVLARHVPLHLFENIYTNRFTTVVIDAHVHETQDVELVIVELRDIPHQAAVSEIGGQLFTFSHAHGGRVVAGGGDMTFDIFGAYGTITRVIRCPDQALRPRRSTNTEEVPPMPRLIVEVEVSNRAVPVVLQRAREFFRCPQVRVVVLVKIFGRRADEQGAFACLAAVLRRRIGAAATQVIAADLVSFGSAALAPTVRASLEPDAYLLRELPLAPHDNTALNANPWLQDPLLRPFLEIAAADIFDGVLDLATNLQVVVDGLPELQIDLWRIYAAVNDYLPQL